MFTKPDVYGHMFCFNNLENISYPELLKTLGLKKCGTFDPLPSGLSLVNAWRESKVAAVCVLVQERGGGRKPDTNTGRHLISG